MNEVRFDYANNDDLRSLLGGLQVGESGKITGLKFIVSRNDENGMVASIKEIEVETEDGEITTEPDVDSAVDIIIAAIEPETGDDEDEGETETDEEGEMFFTG